MASITADKFLYFAYGSNLLAKRIHINNPSAVFVDIGKLNNHQLGFIKESKTWGGPSATIIPVENCQVWGAVWSIDLKDLENLDNQEGVKENWYFAKTVQVMTTSNRELDCRVYQQTVNPQPYAHILELGPGMMPSETYLNCIIHGAIECGLPKDYIEMLKSFPHNGRKACESILKLL